MGSLAVCPPLWSDNELVMAAVPLECAPPRFFFVTAAQTASSFSLQLSTAPAQIFSDNTMRLQCAVMPLCGLLSGPLTGKTSSQSASFASCALRGAARATSLSAEREREKKNRASRTCQCLWTSSDPPCLDVRLLLSLCE